MAKFQKYRVLRAFGLGPGVAVMLNREQAERRGVKGETDPATGVELNPGALLEPVRGKGSSGVYLLLERSDFKVGEVIGLRPDDVSPDRAESLGDVDGELEAPDEGGAVREPAEVINGDRGIKLRPDGRPDMGEPLLTEIVIGRRPDNRPDMGGPVPAGFRLVEEPDALRQDGPTVAEYVAAGYPAANYPPAGWASRSTADEIGAAIAEQNARAPAADQVEGDEHGGEGGHDGDGEHGDGGDAGGERDAPAQ